MVFSLFDEVNSNAKEIHDQEIVVSLKTSSKDRMGKIFLDKMLIQKFADHPVKVVEIFQFNPIGVKFRGSRQSFLLLDLWL